MFRIKKTFHVLIVFLVIGAILPCAALRAKPMVGDKNISGKMLDALQPYVTDGSMNIHDWKLLSGGSDEFNGVALNKKKWSTKARNWGHNWDWSSRNVFIRDGKLLINIRYRPDGRDVDSAAYTSGILKSNLQMRYGFFEARIKGSFPQPGTNPAFWLGNTAKDDRAIWTEIDILEAGSRKSGKGLFRVDHVVHVFRHPDAPTLKGMAGHGWAHNVGGGISSWNPSSGYHIYGVEWTPKKIRMYVDGKLQGSIANRWWHQRLHLILSLGLRPPFRDHPSSVGFPGTMAVDYVRTWVSSSVNKSSGLHPKKKRVYKKRVWRRNILLSH